MPISAENLGFLRAFVFGVFLISTVLTSFEALAQLPVTILKPAGIMKFLPWSFYDKLMTPTGMVVLQWSLLVSLFLSTVGLFTSWSTKAAAFLMLGYQGLLRSFSHYNHDEMLGVYFLIVLAFTPCGDAFSLDKRRGRTGDDSLRYGYPVLLMRILIAWVYFSSALLKLRVAGLSYFNQDNFPALAIYHSLDNLHYTSFKLAFWLPQVREYLPPIVALVVIWELLFPFTIVWRRARIVLLSFGIVFHVLTLFTMNIFFPHLLAMYVVFVNWTRVVEWMRSSLNKQSLSVRSRWGKMDHQVE